MITKIYNRLCRGLWCCGVAVALTACTDTWDEHYEGVGNGGIHEGTLWEAIKSNPELSNFASVVEACDFAKSLNSSQVFTVFAPTNASFSKEEADALISDYKAQKSAGVIEDDNTVLKEFVQNHVALYNYSVATESRDSIQLMNGKYALLRSNDIAGVGMITKNQLYGNGVLYTLNDKVAFLNNVFEYVSKDPDLDSLRSFLYNSKYYYKDFIPERSVAGSIIDGKTHYLDSVFMQRNDLFGYLGQLNIEDSTYMMIAPTNTVWKQLVEENESYYNYPENLTKRDSMVYTKARLAIVDGTTFSRTFNPDKVLQDSAMSVSCVKDFSLREAYWGAPFQYYEYIKPLQAPYGVLNESTADVVTCSNGTIYKTSQWNIDKLMTFHKYIIIEGEDASNVKEISKQVNAQGDSVATALRAMQYVDIKNTFYNKVWSQSYAEYSPATSSVNYSVTYYIRNVLSNIGYDIYLVTAPTLAADSNASAERRLPVILNATLNMPGKGSVALETANPKLKKNTDFVTTTDSVDYLLLAEDFKFDYCTEDVGDEGMQVTLTLKTNVSNSQVRNKLYTRNLNLDCILLVPHGTFYVVDELPETTPYAGTPGIMMFPHGLYNDRPFKWWYMQR